MDVQFRSGEVVRSAAGSEEGGGGGVSAAKEETTISICSLDVHVFTSFSAWQGFPPDFR